MMIITLLISLSITLQNTDMNIIKENIYDINIKMIDGTDLNWSLFKGKKILIVNVASECGFTPQYAQLQELSESFENELIVLGVPCNDFGGQEPGSAEQIQSFCSTNYKITFPVTEKIGITQKIHPLYKWLTQSDENGKGDFEVKWNFTKFLINEDGTIENSFPSSVSPLDEEILRWVKS